MSAAYLSPWRAESGMPVLPDGPVEPSALRYLDRGTWHLTHWSRVGGDLRVVSMEHCVVDDFGDLAPVDVGLRWDGPNEWFYDSHRIGLEESAYLHVERERRRRREVQRLERRAEETRALLRPGPIVAEIHAEAEDWVAAEIRVGADPRPVADVPCYRVSVSGNDSIVVTHAQLSALLAAAQEICMPLRDKRGTCASLGVIGRAAQ